MSKQGPAAVGESGVIMCTGRVKDACSQEQPDSDMLPTDLQDGYAEGDSAMLDMYVMTTADYAIRLTYARVRAHGRACARTHVASRYSFASREFFASVGLTDSGNDRIELSIDNTNHAFLATPTAAAALAPNTTAAPTAMMPPTYWGIPLTINNLAKVSAAAVAHVHERMHGRRLKETWRQDADDRSGDAPEYVNNDLRSQQVKRPCVVGACDVCGQRVCV